MLSVKHSRRVLLTSLFMGIVLFLVGMLCLIGEVFAEGASQGGAGAVSGAVEPAAGPKQQTAQQQQQQAGQEKGMAQQAAANENPAGYAYHMGQAEELQQLSLENFAKVDSARSIAKAGDAVYDSPISSGGGDSGGGGYWSSAPMEITPLPIDDYVGRLHSNLASNPRLAAGLSQGGDYPEMPAGQGYIPPPDDFINESPSFSNGAFDPLYGSQPLAENPANALANMPLIPAEMVYNPAFSAHNALQANPAASGNTQVSPQVTAHVSPRPIPSVAIREILAELEYPQPQDGVIASLPVTAEIASSDDLVPVIAGMAPDRDFEGVESAVYAYSAPEYIDSDGYFYSSMHKKLSNSTISAVYEEGGMFEEVTAFGLPVNAQYYFSGADSKLFRVDDQVTLVASRKDPSASSLEIEENPVKAYLIRLFGSLNDISINQSVLEDSRGGSMDVYFITVNRAGARNMVIYAHQGHIIGVKFLDSKEQVASSPMYVQEQSGAAALQSMLANSQKFMDNAVDKGSVGFVPPETPLVKETAISATGAPVPQATLVPLQLTRNEPGVSVRPLGFAQDSGLLKSTVIATANSIITRSLKSPQGDAALTRPDLKLKLPEQTPLISETDTIPFNTRAFMLF